MAKINNLWIFGNLLCANSGDGVDGTQRENEIDREGDKGVCQRCWSRGRTAGVRMKGMKEGKCNGRAGEGFTRDGGKGWRTVWNRCILRCYLRNG